MFLDAVAVIVLALPGCSSPSDFLQEPPTSGLPVVVRRFGRQARIKSKTGFRLSAASPSGNRLAVLDEAGKLVLWNLKDYRLMSTKDLDPTSRYSDMAFLDEHRLALPNYKNAMEIWDTRDGLKETGLWDWGRMEFFTEWTVRRFGAAGPVYLGYHKLLAVADDTGKLHLEFKGTAALEHQGSITALDMTKDGHRLYSGGKPIIEWDPKEGRAIRKFGGFESPVTCMSVSEDGKILVSGHKNGSVMRWITESGKGSVLLGADNSRRQAVWCGTVDEGRRIVVVFLGGRVIQLEGTEIVSELSAAGPIIPSVSWIPENQTLVLLTAPWGADNSGDEKYEVILWDAVHNRRKGPGGDPPLQVSLAVPADLVVSSSTITASLWQASTGKWLDSPILRSLPAKRVAVSGCGKYLFLAGANGRLDIADWPAGKQQVSLRLPASLGKLLTAQQSSIVVWESQDELTAIRPGSATPTVSIQLTQPVLDVALSNDGDYVAGSEYGGALKVWETLSGKSVAEYAFRRPICDFAFAGGANWIVGAAGRCLVRIDRRSGVVTSVDLEDVVERVAGASQTRVIYATGSRLRMYDFDTSRTAALEGGHEAAIIQLVTSADEKTLLSVSSDGEMIIWAIPGGKSDDRR